MIVQEAYSIPDDITTGLATGLYQRCGSVVRYAMGKNKGKIVKHLDPICLGKVEQAQKMRGIMDFVQRNKKAAGITVVGAAAIGVCVWGYNKRKKREPKVLVEFRTELKAYIDAIRSGKLCVERINSLMNSLEALKEYKDYDQISIQLTTEDLEILVGRIYDYTIKLVADNDLELAEGELKQTDGAIINLQSYLKVQRRVFESAS